VKTGRYLIRGGLRLHFVDQGSGLPVVMVHGNPTWSIYYRKLVEALSGFRRVLVPDHIGMGLSDKPGDGQYDYTLKSRVDDLELLLEREIPAGPVDLVVHDWGGMIGMGWAVRHPERVRRIVVLNTAAFFPPPSKPLPGTLRLTRTILGSLLVRGLNAFALGATYFCVKKPMSQELRAAYTAPYGNWRDRIAVLRFVQDIPTRPGDAAWDQVQATQDGLSKLAGKPMLVCWGGKDFVFDGDFLAEWRRRFPKADVHLFEEAGHYVLEDAADKVIPLVKKFLAD
jgi:haloalkane dehalogenase